MNPAAPVTRHFMRALSSNHVWHRFGCPAGRGLSGRTNTATWGGTADWAHLPGNFTSRRETPCPERRGRLLISWDGRAAGTHSVLFLESILSSGAECGVPGSVHSTAENHFDVVAGLSRQGLALQLSELGLKIRPKS